MTQIYNSWSKEYKSVFGALKTGELCRFSIRLSKEVIYDTNPVMIIFRNGFKERYLVMHKSFENDEYTEFSTEYTPNFMGVHYYYFGLSNNGVRFFIKKQKACCGVIGDGELFQLTVYDSEYYTPNFLKGGIIYQIFPDRFYNSGMPKQDIPTDRFIHNNWGDTPFYRPDEKGHVWNNDYFGGDLQGIIQKLDYIKSLGTTCIYLNPIFEAHENHRYNTANYMTVDPLLGTNDDFKELCEKAKEMGISVILDGVFNHTGADSIYFNKYNRYENIGAYNSKSSPYYKWYTFIDYPNKYEAWWGIDTLPDVNEENKDYTDFICGEKGVLKYWLSQGASGFRLDVADELPDSFLDRLNKCVKDDSPENVIIGEVWEDASNKESYGVKRRYLLGQQLDSVMNYPFKDAIMYYFKNGSGEIFKSRIMTILENYPKPSIDCLMNFISTHDIQRAITAFGGDSCESKSKDWQAERYLTWEQYDHGKSLLKCAMVLQYFLPGVPSIYYGDEAGLQGYCDPFNRRCYPWGREDHDLLNYVRELGTIRSKFKEYLSGRFEFYNCDDNMVSFFRYNDDETKAMLVVLNKGDSNITFDLNDIIEKGLTISETIKGEMYENSLNINARSYAIVSLAR